MSKSGLAGATKLFPIIGRPVDEVFSPPAFNSWFENNDLNVRMVAIDITSEDLRLFLNLIQRSKTFLGCSITYPHKQDAFKLVDQKTSRANRLGALNTIRCESDGYLSGDATDGLAMISAIQERGIGVENRTAFVMGAGGGAGQAIVDALCEKGITEIILKEVNPEREKIITTQLSKYWPHIRFTTEEKGADILINATTLGKKPEDILPFTEMHLKEAQIVCDVVTGMKPTALIDLAKRLDKKCVTGDDMGAHQLFPQLKFLGLTKEDLRRE